MKIKKWLLTLGVFTLSTGAIVPLITSCSSPEVTTQADIKFENTFNAELTRKWNENKIDYVDALTYYINTQQQNGEFHSVKNEYIIATKANGTLIINNETIQEINNHYQELIGKKYNFKSLNDNRELKGKFRVELLREFDSQGLKFEDKVIFHLQDKTPTGFGEVKQEMFVIATNDGSSTNNSLEVQQQVEAKYNELLTNRYEYDGYQDLRFVGTFDAELTRVWNENKIDYIDLLTFGVTTNKSDGTQHVHKEVYDITTKDNGTLTNNAASTQKVENHYQELIDKNYKFISYNDYRSLNGKFKVELLRQRDQQTNAYKEKVVFYIQDKTQSGFDAIKKEEFVILSNDGNVTSNISEARQKADARYNELITQRYEYNGYQDLRFVGKFNAELTRNWSENRVDYIDVLTYTVKTNNPNGIHHVHFEKYDIAFKHNGNVLYMKENIQFVKEDYQTLLNKDYDFIDYKDARDINGKFRIELQRHRQPQTNKYEDRVVFYIQDKTAAGFSEVKTQEFIVALNYDGTLHQSSEEIQKVNDKLNELLNSKYEYNGYTDARYVGNFNAELKRIWAENKIDYTDVLKYTVKTKKPDGTYHEHPEEYDIAFKHNGNVIYMKENIQFAKEDYQALLNKDYKFKDYKDVRDIKGKFKVELVRHRDPQGVKYEDKVVFYIQDKTPTGFGEIKKEEYIISFNYDGTLHQSSVQKQKADSRYNELLNSHFEYNGYTDARFIGNFNAELKRIWAENKIDYTDVLKYTVKTKKPDGTYHEHPEEYDIAFKHNGNVIYMKENIQFVKEDYQALLNKDYDFIDYKDARALSGIFNVELVRQRDPQGVKYEDKVVFYIQDKTPNGFGEIKKEEYIISFNYDGTLHQSSEQKQKADARYNELLNSQYEYNGYQDVRFIGNFNAELKRIWSENKIDYTDVLKYTVKTKKPDGTYHEHPEEYDIAFKHNGNVIYMKENIQFVKEDYQALLNKDYKFVDYKDARAISGKFNVELVRQRDPQGVKYEDKVVFYIQDKTPTGFGEIKKEEYIISFNYDGTLQQSSEQKQKADARYNELLNSQYEYNGYQDLRFVGTLNAQLSRIWSDNKIDYIDVLTYTIKTEQPDGKYHVQEVPYDIYSKQNGQVTSIDKGIELANNNFQTLLNKDYKFVDYKDARAISGKFNVELVRQRDPQGVKYEDKVVFYIQDKTPTGFGEIKKEEYIISFNYDGTLQQSSEQKQKADARYNELLNSQYEYNGYQDVRFNGSFSAKLVKTYRPNNIDYDVDLVYTIKTKQPDGSYHEWEESYPIGETVDGFLLYITKNVQYVKEDYQALLNKDYFFSGLIK